MKKTIKIKVCGLRNATNIKNLASLNLDYYGLIYHEKSSRHIDYKKISIPKEIQSKTVLVSVNQPKEKVLKITELLNLKNLQLHGNESPELCSDYRQNGYFVIKVFSVDNQFDFLQCKDYVECSDLFLFDTKGTNEGGNGTKFNWNKLNEYNLHKDFLLAGGISPEDVNGIKLINHKNFIGIDLNSRFEDKPALKNITKIKSFINDIN